MYSSSIIFASHLAVFTNLKLKSEENKIFTCGYVQSQLNATIDRFLPVLECYAMHLGIRRSLCVRKHILFQFSLQAIVANWPIDNEQNVEFSQERVVLFY